ncbi:MAG: sigma-70 family RNA polymerase sigma factor [Planctomycetia bacterium]|nr:sigma-70 family RNA polymerase sigma factor [Planctomycetia bacterium]
MEFNVTDDSQNQRFYNIVWPERAHVLRCALFLTHKTSDAEDLAQETLLKAWRALDNFDLRKHGVRPWLLTILKNTWRDSLRLQNRRGVEVPLDDLIETPAAPETQDSPLPSGPSSADIDALLQGFSDQHVVDALRCLHHEFRWVLLLVDVSSLSYDQAATLLEVPVGTVRSRLFRGREALRNILMRREKTTPPNNKLR